MSKRNCYLSLLFFALSVSAFAQATPSKMVVTAAGSQTSSKGPVENFEGNVRVDPLFKAQETTRATGAYVTFDPGARSAWHTHPNGQTLVVTEGVGRVQEWGKEIKVIKKGDVIWTPPGVKHWHGATQDSAMTHFSITEALPGGKSVEWLEKVSNAK